MPPAKNTADARSPAPSRSQRARPDPYDRPMSSGPLVAIAAPGWRRGRSTRRRQRHADHLPGAARVRLRAGHGERSNTIGLVPGSVSGASATAASSRASAAARSGWARRCSAASPGRCCCWCCPRRRSRRSSRSSSRSRCCWSSSSRGSTPARRAQARRDHERGLVVALAIFLTGVYGGYFGAAQGILLLGILGSRSPRTCSGSTRQERPRRPHERRRRVFFIAPPRSTGPSRSSRAAPRRRTDRRPLRTRLPAARATGADRRRRPRRDRAPAHDLSRGAQSVLDGDDEVARARCDR